MNPRIAPAQAALLSLCFLMAALTVYELSVPPAEFVLPVVHLKPSVAEARPPPAFIAPPPESFSAINDRPVFIPSRKPLTVPADKTTAATAGAPPALPSLALVGVILDGQNSLAMVRLAGASFAQAMAVGASIGGWQITSITPDKIVLHAGTFEQDVRLDAKPAGQAPAGPPPPPGSPQ
jgi:general secretion pathway protein N